MTFLRILFSGVFSWNYIPAYLCVVTSFLFITVGIVFAKRAGVILIAADGITYAAGTAAFLADAAVTGGAGGSSGWAAGIFAGLAAGMLFTALWILILRETGSGSVLPGLVLNFASYAISDFFIHRSGLAEADASPIPMLPALGGDGSLFFRLFGRISMFTLAAVLVVFAAFYLLDRTDFGFCMRSVEENPSAAVSAGIRPEKIQAAGLLFAGAAVSFGGISLTLARSTPCVTDIPRWEGYLALAAVFMGAGRIGKSCISAGILALFMAAADTAAGEDAYAVLAAGIPYFAALIGIWICSRRSRKRRLRDLRSLRKRAAADRAQHRKKGISG